MPIIYSNSNIIKILSSYIGKFWNIFSVFLLVPVYIYYLGLENYGIIGFYAVVLGIISFADAGMSSAITREFALNEKSSLKYHVLRKIELIYWVIIILIFFVIFFFSDILASKWLTADYIEFSDLNNYIILIGVSSGFQLISSIYFGALFGLGEQIKANIYQIIWTTCRVLFVVILFEVLGSNLYVFLMWQILCNVLYIILLRWQVVKELKKKDGIAPIPFNHPIPERILIYIGGMAIVSIIAAINLQSDKLIISYFFSLKIFSVYTLASILSQIPIMISAPLAGFVFPLLSRFSQSINEFNQIFRAFTTLLYLIIFSMSFLIFFYPLEIFTLWSGQTLENSLNDDLSFLIKILTLGSILLAMQFPFYYTLLAHSKTKYTVYQGIFQILIGLPLLVFLVKYYGIKYAGISWLFINLLAFIYLMLICLRGYINMSVSDFIVRYILIQSILGFLVAWLGYTLYQLYSIPLVIILFLSSILSFFIILILGNILDKRNLLSYNHLYNFPRV